jgi:flagellar biogenesis protein FliO
MAAPTSVENSATSVSLASSEPLALKNTTATKPDLKKNVLRNFIGLMIVLALLLLLVTLYKRTHLYKNFHEQPLRIVLSLALSPKQKLAVVELFGGYSLVAISEKNVNLIQVLQPSQAMALQAYLSSRKPSLLAARQTKPSEVSQDEKTGFENLLKKILNNPGPPV